MLMSLEITATAFSRDNKWQN